ncbi:MAG: MoaD/ThiS family protein [Planctomycetales bacterium]|nr:MoaD/ThiS family protein [Planctomycetales bacterium]
MTIQIRIPSSLRELTDQQAEIEVAANSVEDAIQELVGRFPRLEGKLLSPSGELHSFLNIFVGERNIRDMQGLATEIPSGQTLLIVSALAGG